MPDILDEKLQSKTRAHYDQYPFIQGGDNRIAWWREYLADFLPNDRIRDKLILDLGSSVGEISRGLIDRGARMVCLDISLASLRHCCATNPEAEVVHGTALQLPFPDASFDHTLSIGVLHHTPDCRLGFKELARVTAPGGILVVFLYNYWNVYNLIYHAFAPVRALIPLERVPSFFVSLLQPFAKTHLGQSLDQGQLRNLLGDKLWTPQATFHSVAEVRRWGREEGLEFTGLKRFYLGYANVMRFVKNGAPNEAIRREIQLKCLQCGKKMVSAGAFFACTGCTAKYPRDGAVIETLRQDQ